MADGEDAPQKGPLRWGIAWPQRSERMVGYPAPRGVRPFVRLHWKRIALWLMLLVGMAVQVIVVALVYELVDLTISLMEVWAELARKHLEITLT